MRYEAALFKALGDETRLRMIYLLLHHRELCVCDFMKVLGITQSKASRHLRNLYHAGLVSDRRDGLWVHYSIHRPQSSLVRSLLRALKADRGDDQEAGELLDSMARCLAERGSERLCSG